MIIKTFEALVMAALIFFACFSPVLFIDLFMIYG